MFHSVLSGLIPTSHSRFSSPTNHDTALLSCHREVALSSGLTVSLTDSVRSWIKCEGSFTAQRVRPIAPVRYERPAAVAAVQQVAGVVAHVLVVVRLR